MNELSVFENAELRGQTLANTKDTYQPHTPDWYLYHLVCRFAGNKFSTEFIELVYVTLSAWGMNSRAARLSNFSVFEKSILDNEGVLKKLESYKINMLSKNTDIIDALEKLFFNLELVAKGNPPLVTFSKMMHFFFPELIVPIDRQYTLNFFKAGDFGKNSAKKQWDIFVKIETEFSKYSEKIDLTSYLNDKWNLSIPKIMDNMVIGYIKLKTKSPSGGV